MSEEGASYGLCVDRHRGYDTRSSIGGKQTVNVAEGMAAVHALLLSDMREDMHVYTDSKVIMDGVEALWNGTTRGHRVYKDMANYSIIKTIHDM